MVIPALLTKRDIRQLRNNLPNVWMKSNILPHIFPLAGSALGDWIFFTDVVLTYLNISGAHETFSWDFSDIIILSNDKLCYRFIMINTTLMNNAKWYNETNTWQSGVRSCCLKAAECGRQGNYCLCRWNMLLQSPSWSASSKSYVSARSDGSSWCQWFVSFNSKKYVKFVIIRNGSVRKLIQQQWSVRPHHEVDTKACDSGLMPGLRPANETALQLSLCFCRANLFATIATN